MPVAVAVEPVVVGVEAVADRLLVVVGAVEVAGVLVVVEVVVEVLVVVLVEAARVEVAGAVAEVVARVALAAARAPLEWMVQTGSRECPVKMVTLEWMVVPERPVSRDARATPVKTAILVIGARLASRGGLEVPGTWEETVEAVEG
jgi:hypothetical protein